MKFTDLFKRFIDQGHKPTSTKESNQLLDEARSVVLDIARRAGTGELKVASGTDAQALQVQAQQAQRKELNPELFGKTPGGGVYRKGSFFDPDKKTAKASPTPAASVKPTPTAKPAPVALKPAPAAKAPELFGQARVQAAFKAESEAKKPTPAPAPVAAAPVAIPHSTQLLAIAILDEQEKRAAAAKIRTRAQFNAMTPREKNEYIRNGGKLVD